MYECSLEDAVKVDYFTDLWKKQDQSLKVEQKDGIGLAFLKHIIGVDDCVIQAFLEDNNNATYTVGMRQAGIMPCKSDYSAFWKTVAQIVPNAYSEKDLEFLIKNGGSGPNIMTFYMIRVYGSHVLSKIDVNAHAYK
jgi:hypothetical protein